MFEPTARSAFGSDWTRTMRAHIWEKNLYSVDVTHGPIVGFYTDGWAGQHLFIWPAARMVAVRQTATPADAQTSGELPDTRRGFFDQVRALAPDVAAAERARSASE
jgi:hypothetical protein